MHQSPRTFLFVCTGNICRSPLAEAVARTMAEKSGKALVFDSAGTGSWHEGETPDPRSIQAAERRGYDLTGQVARAVTAEDFDTFDYLIALDHSHERWLHSRRAALRKSEKPISRLLDWSVGRVGQDVPDPYYDDDQAFDHVLDLIEAGCQGLVTRA